jgi:hypothetical protein
MKGRTARAEATHALTLMPLKEQCEQCGQPLWVGYHAHRTVTRLDGLWKLTIVVRRCIQPDCPRYHVAYRPEEEGRWAGTATLSGGRTDRLLPGSANGLFRHG